jgi:hypothetical protein
MMHGQKTIKFSNLVVSRRKLINHDNQYLWSGVGKLILVFEVSHKGIQSQNLNWTQIENKCSHKKPFLSQ